jgi:hypothetical protein
MLAEKTTTSEDFIELQEFLSELQLNAKRSVKDLIHTVVRENFFPLFYSYLAQTFH